MDKEIKIALIGLCSAVLAALIGLVGVLISREKKKAKSEAKAEPTQKQENCQGAVQMANASVGHDQIIVTGQYNAAPAVAPAQPAIHPDKPGHSYRMGEVMDEHLDWRKSRDYFKQAADEHIQVTGPASFERADALVRAGIKHAELAEYQAAISCWLEAEAIFLKEPDKNQANIAAIYGNIAVVYDDQSKYDKALEWAFKALAIHEKVLGKKHPDTAKTYNNIANVYYEQDEYNKALEWYSKALAIRIKVLGEKHPNTAKSNWGIALVSYAQGRYEEALRLYSEVLAVLIVLGKDHPDVAAIYTNIANVYRDQGNPENALEFYVKAYNIFAGKFDPDHPDAKLCRNSMEQAYAATNPTQPFEEWLAEQMK